jgi:hypothetical protein
MRVTEKDLKSVVDRINKITGSPMEPYPMQGEKWIAQVGNYHINGAYGGWQLCRMANAHGGVRNVMNSGYVSKKELYNLMQAFLYGLKKR